MNDTSHAGTKWFTFRKSDYGPLALDWLEESRDDSGCVMVRDPYFPNRTVKRKMSEFMTEEQAVAELVEWNNQHPSPFWESVKALRESQK